MPLTTWIEGIEIPTAWLPSERIMDALKATHRSIKRHDLLERIAEAIRINSAESALPWYSQAIRENYLALIIEGKILIGS